MGKWKDVRNKAYDLINANLVGGSNPLQAIYKAHNADPSGYPYCTIGPSELPSNGFTNAENVRTYGLDIYVWHSVENSNVGEQNALDAVMDITNQVIDLLDQYPTFEGVADAGVDPVEATMRIFESPVGLMVGSRITVRCKAVYQYRST